MSIICYITKRSTQQRKDTVTEEQKSLAILTTVLTAVHKGILPPVDILKISEAKPRIWKWRDTHPFMIYIEGIHILGHIRPILETPGSYSVAFTADCGPGKAECQFVQQIDTRFIYATTLSIVAEHVKVSPKKP